MAVRGYRMSDVDWAMRRLGAEIDRLRAELDRTVGDDRPSPPAADEPTDQRVFAVVTPAEVTPGSAARTEDTAPRSGPMTVRVGASVDVPVDAATAFAAVVDLPSQERWIMLTRLYALEGDVPVPEVGSRFLAFTGVASVGFLDNLVVTEYDPPRRWVARHEGEFVKGAGIMQVEPLGAGSRVTFTEELELPFGILGRLGWPLARRRPVGDGGLPAQDGPIGRRRHTAAVPGGGEAAAVRRPVGSGMRAVPHGAMRRGDDDSSLPAPGADRTASIPGRLDHRDPGTPSVARRRRRSTTADQASTTAAGMARFGRRGSDGGGSTDDCGAETLLRVRPACSRRAVACILWLCKPYPPETSSSPRAGPSRSQGGLPTARTGCGSRASSGSARRSGR